MENIDEYCRKTNGWEREKKENHQNLRVHVYVRE